MWQICDYLYLKYASGQNLNVEGGPKCTLFVLCGPSSDCPPVSAIILPRSDKHIWSLRGFLARVTPNFPPIKFPFQLSEIELVSFCFNPLTVTSPAHQHESSQELATSVIFSYFLFPSSTHFETHTIHSYTNSQIPLTTKTVGIHPPVESLQ